MKKTKFNYKHLCNIVCIVLTLVMVAVMFMPFWVFPEKEVETSLVDYLWFTTDHPGMEKLIKEWTGIKKIQEVMNDYILPLFFGFVLGAVGVIAGIFKSKTLWAPIAGLGASAFMVIGLVTEVAFKYGQNYGLMLAVSVVALVGCLGTVVMNIVVKAVANYKKNAKYREFNKAQMMQQK